MGKKTYLSQLTSGIGGKMSKRIYEKCPNINKMDCLVNKPFENVVENVIKNVIENVAINDFIIVYTFDIQTNTIEEEDINRKMLIMSILSCIREFKDLTFKIFIYTTNINTLYDYLMKYETIMKYITIEKYDPTVYGLPQQLSLGNDCNNCEQLQQLPFDDNNVLNEELLFDDNNGLPEQFSLDTILKPFSLDTIYEPFINGIGHSRVFIIDGLRKKYKCPIVYMDNDTGISLGNGSACYEMIKQTNTIRFYQIEKWTSFRYLFKDIGKLENFMEIGRKYDDTLNVNTVIRNNGIIIYGYTNNISDNNTVEKAIILIQDIYKLLLYETHSHYNDMYAFSIACDMLDINNVICDIYIDYEIDKNLQKIVINQQPIFNHYYYNKHYYAGYVNYIFNNIIILYFENKPLELPDDLRKDNIHCLLTNIFTHDQGESFFYDYAIPIPIGDDIDGDDFGIYLSLLCWNDATSMYDIPCQKRCYNLRKHAYYAC